jgi:bifunctional non-homologous end joining protein LigD
MVWDRGYWNCGDPERAFAKGKLDFKLEGEKLRGGWILTRMRKREGEKRTNWLLIKHRDKFSREGKKNRILDEDASVASSRSMEKIAAGKGRGPKPFVMAKRSRAPANAVESHRANPRIRGKKTVLSRNGANPGVDRARRLLELIAGRGGESVTMGCV